MTSPTDDLPPYPEDEARARLMAVARSAEDMHALMRADREAQAKPVGSEPVAEVAGSPNVRVVRFLDPDNVPPVGTKLYAHPPVTQSDPIGRIRAEIAHLNRMLGDMESSDPVGFMSLSARRDDLLKDLAKLTPVTQSEQQWIDNGKAISRAVSVMQDVLNDIADWEDTALADEVAAARIGLLPLLMQDKPVTQSVDVQAVADLIEALWRGDEGADADAAIFIGRLTGVTTEHLPPADSKTDAGT